MRRSGISGLTKRRTDPFSFAKPHLPSPLWGGFGGWGSWGLCRREPAQSRSRSACDDPHPVALRAPTLPARGRAWRAQNPFSFAKPHLPSPLWGGAGGGGRGAFAGESLRKAAPDQHATTPTPSRCARQPSPQGGGHGEREIPLVSRNLTSPPPCGEGSGVGGRGALRRERLRKAALDQHAQTSET